MLEELIIKNAILDLEFNEYTYEYTVKIDNIEYLDFEYKICQDCFISIRDNNLINNNTVYIDVFDYNNKVTYTFNTYKENNSYTLQIENYMNSIESNKEKINTTYIELLSIGIFLLIIITFSILFRRRIK